MGYTILIALLVNGLLSIAPAYMAKNKGYSFGGFYAVSFFFSFLGVIIIAAIIPDLVEAQLILEHQIRREIAAEQAENKGSANDKPANQEFIGPVCSSCGAPLKPGKKYCVVCSAEVEGNEIYMPEVISKDTIRCPKCGVQQKSIRTSCYRCKTQFVELSQRPQQ